MFSATHYSYKNIKAIKKHKSSPCCNIPCNLVDGNEAFRKFSVLPVVVLSILPEYILEIEKARDTSGYIHPHFLAIKMGKYFVCTSSSTSNGCFYARFLVRLQVCGTRTVRGEINAIATEVIST
jgi:hypothetical protein